MDIGRDVEVCLCCRHEWILWLARFIVRGNLSWTINFAQIAWYLGRFTDNRFLSFAELNVGSTWWRVSQQGFGISGGVESPRQLSLMSPAAKRLA